MTKTCRKTLGEGKVVNGKLKTLTADAELEYSAVFKID